MKGINMSTAQINKLGFTIVELALVIAVVGILAAISIVGYGAWRDNVATSEIKNDLSAVAAAMNSAKNWNKDGFPVLDSGTTFDGNDDTKSIFTQSSGVHLTYQSGDAKEYCIEGQSLARPTIVFFVDSTHYKSPVKGTCAGGVGAMPVIPPTEVDIASCAAPHGGTGSPSSPQEISLQVPVGNSIRAEWQAPSSAGSSAVSSYRLCVLDRSSGVTYQYDVNALEATENTYGGSYVASASYGYGDYPDATAFYSSAGEYEGGIVAQSLEARPPVGTCVANRLYLFMYAQNSTGYSDPATYDLTACGVTD